MSLWDKLPIEIQDYIHKIKDVIIYREQEELLSCISTERLLKQLYSRENNKETRSNIFLTHKHENIIHKGCILTLDNIKQFVDFEVGIYVKTNNSQGYNNQSINLSKCNYWNNLNEEQKLKECENILSKVYSKLFRGNQDSVFFDYDLFYTISSECFESLKLN